MPSSESEPNDTGEKPTEKKSIWRSILRRFPWKLAAVGAIAVSVLWQNGSVTTGWSKTDVANVALMILALDEDQRRKHL